VTGAAVGLGIGVLGSLVVGKLIEDATDCAPAVRGTTRLLPDLLGLTNPRCRGARVHQGGGLVAQGYPTPPAQGYPPPQANFQVPSTVFQYTPEEKYPVSSINQYQGPQYPAATNTDDTVSLLTSQYQGPVPVLGGGYDGPELFHASPQYPKHTPENQYLSSQYQGSHYQGPQYQTPVENQQTSTPNDALQPSRPAPQQFSFSLPASAANRPDGLVPEAAHLPEGGYLTYPTTKDQSSQASSLAGYPQVSSQDSQPSSILDYDLKPNPFIQPRTLDKPEILAETEGSDAIVFPRARVPRQGQWHGRSAFSQTGFSQTAPHKATADEVTQEPREARSQNGFRQTGFSQTAPHKATADEVTQEPREARSQNGFRQTGFSQTAPHKATIDQNSRQERSIPNSAPSAPREDETKSIRRRQSITLFEKSKHTAISRDGRSLEQRAPPPELGCKVDSESHRQCAGLPDGRSCEKSCRAPDCREAVCCGGCCKRPTSAEGQKCSKKKWIEVEILDV